MDRNNNNRSNEPRVPRGLQPAGDQDNVLNVDDNGVAQDPPNLAVLAQQNLQAQNNPGRQDSVDSLHNIPFAGDANAAAREQAQGNARGNQANVRGNQLRNSQQQPQQRNYAFFHFRQLQAGQQQHIGRIRQIHMRQMMDQFGANWGLNDQAERAAMEQLYENLNYERQQIPPEMLRFNEEEKLQKQKEDQQSKLHKYAGPDPRLPRDVEEEEKCDGAPSEESYRREQQIMHELVFNAERRAFLKMQERMNRQNDGEIFSSLVSQQIDLDARSCATVQSDIPAEVQIRLNNEVQTLDQVPQWKKSALQSQRLLMIFLSWQKQSHGLFDYELRHVVRHEHSVSRSINVVRNGTTIKLAEIDQKVDDDKVDKNEQLLFTVTKQANCYEIDGVNIDPTKDIDDCYTENGTNTLDPAKMHERMYHAVRFLRLGIDKQENKFEAQNYLLKKNDIVKLGRIKMKVKQLFTKAGHQAREKTLMRRRERLANEHMVSRAKMQKQRLVNPNRPGSSTEIYKSKYGLNYDQLSLGSNASIHDPIVGENNYATALTPIKRKRKRKSAEVKAAPGPQLSDKEDCESSKLKNRQQSFYAKNVEQQQDFMRSSSSNNARLPYVSSVVQDLTSQSSVNQNLNNNGIFNSNSENNRGNNSNSRNHRDTTQEPVSRRPIDNEEESKHGSRSGRSDSQAAGQIREPRNLLDQIAYDLNRIEPANRVLRNQREQNAAARRVENGNAPRARASGVIDLQMNGVFEHPFDPELSPVNVARQQQLNELQQVAGGAQNRVSDASNRDLSVENNKSASNNEAGNESSGAHVRERHIFSNQNFDSMGGGIQQSFSAPNIGVVDQAQDFVLLSESSSSFFQSERQISEQVRQGNQEPIREVQQSQAQQKQRPKLLNLRSHDIMPARRLAEEAKSAEAKMRAGAIANLAQAVNRANQNAPDGQINSVSMNQERSSRLVQPSPERKISAGTPSQSSIDASDKNSSSDSEARKHEFSNPDKISIYSDTQIQCRVCWGETCTTEDPLLRVCQCRGGLEFIHFSCLKNWIQTKEEKSTYSTYTMIQIKQFECEICKNELPYVFMNNGNRYSLIDLPLHGSDHLILESISLDVKSMRLFFILHPNRARNNILQRNVVRKVKYRIGRGHDCHLRLTDISASRNHAEIVYEKGEFRLSDTMSKFGTLVLARKPITVSDGVESAVQIGRSLVLFKTVDEPLKISKQIGFIQGRNEEGLSAVKSFHEQRKSFREQEVLMERSGIKKPGDRTPKSDEDHDTVKKFYGMSNFDFMAYLNYIEDNYYRQDIMNKQQMELQFLAQLQSQQKLEEDQDLKNMGLPYDKAVQKKKAVEEDLKKRRDHFLLANEKLQNEAVNSGFKEKIRKEEMELELEQKKGMLTLNITRNSQASSALVHSLDGDSELDARVRVPVLEQNTQQMSIFSEEEVSSEKAEIKEIDQVGRSLNKGVQREDHMIEPSEEFLQACRMFGKKPNPLLPNVNEIPTLKERETSHQREDVDEMLGEQRQRFLITWRNRVDYQNLRRAKFLQNEHKGQPMTAINGQRLPKKIALSHQFFSEHIKVDKQKDQQSDEKSLMSEVADEQPSRKILDNSSRNSKDKEKSSEQAKMIKQLCFHRKKLMCQLIAAEEAFKTAKFKAREAAEEERKAKLEAAERAKQEREQKVQEAVNTDQIAADQIMEKSKKVEVKPAPPKREKKTERMYLQQAAEEGRKVDRLREDVSKIDYELKCMKRFEEQHEVLKVRQKVIRNDIQRIWRLHVQNSVDNHKAQQDEHAKRRFR